MSNQVKTRTKKRADILAVDRNGNAVVVELKRDEGKLGVETQALQYLSDFSSYRARRFSRRTARRVPLCKGFGSATAGNHRHS